MIPGQQQADAQASSRRYRYPVASSSSTQSQPMGMPMPQAIPFSGFPTAQPTPMAPAQAFPVMTGMAPPPVGQQQQYAQNVEPAAQPDAWQMYQQPQDQSQFNQAYSPDFGGQQAPPPSQGQSLVDRTAAMSMSMSNDCNLSLYDVDDPFMTQVDTSLNCRGTYMSLTMNAIPSSKELLNKVRYRSYSNICIVFGACDVDM